MLPTFLRVPAMTRLHPSGTTAPFTEIHATIRTYAAIMRTDWLIKRHRRPSKRALLIGKTTKNKDDLINASHKLARTSQTQSTHTR
jgi:hypothetical protein